MIKKAGIGLLILVLFSAGFISVLYLESPNYDRLNFIQQHMAKTIADRFEAKINSMPKDRRTIVDYDTLMSSLNFIQRNFAGRIFSIDPKDLGFKGPFYSMGRPTDLVEIKSVKLGDGRETGIQFCPEHSYKDYLKMIAAMEKDIGKKLLIDSGYRSPGRQAYLFFHYLPGVNYSLRENAKWIAMPGYSQHGDPVYNAIDFTSQEGINGFSEHQKSSDFAALPEYKWMLENANKFHFYLSYPKDNKWGVAFEPWHWHWDNQ